MNYWVAFGLKLWISAVFALATTSALLALVRLRLGLRVYYTKLLLASFDWARGRLGTADEDGSDHSPTASDASDEPIRKLTMTTSADIIRPEAYKNFAERVAQQAATDSHAEIDILDIMDDSLDMLKWGMEVIITDEVTNSFTVADLSVWNLLTRTDKGYTFVSWRLSIMVTLGKIFRYGMMVPARLCIFFMALSSLFVSSIVVGVLPSGAVRRAMAEFCLKSICRLCARMVSLIVTYHDRENKPKPGTICVANHTSYLDMALLGSDNYFGVVGQKWPGFQGFLQKLGGILMHCVWFERTDSKDRHVVIDIMRDHIAAGGPPILIFPEGTCANNRSIMRFRKGSFEVGATMHPVVIKYDRRFGEPFYYQDTWYQHLAAVITCWAIKADVYYLPPMQQEEGESAIEFAGRVKEAIAMKGEFVDVDWDGYVKMLPVREEKIQDMRRFYSERLKRIRIEMDMDDLAYISAEE